MFYTNLRGLPRQGIAVAVLLLAIMFNATLYVSAATDPTVFALSNSNRLLQFNEARPDRILAQVAISGLARGEQMLGIDFRPATGQLYGVSNANQLYVIDTTTGAASKVGGAFAIPLNFSAEIGVDFNPVVDRLRIVTDNGQNLRANPDTGALVDADPNTPAIDPDGALAYAAADANSGKTPNVVAAAYTNNFAGTTTTVLYNIDSDLDVLVRQDPPNAGALNTVGALRVNASDVVGFDIFTNEDGDNARAAIRQGNSNQSEFYTVDLVSGQAKLKKKGVIGGGEPIRDIAITPNG
jgi:hypothetical protein